MMTLGPKTFNRHLTRRKRRGSGAGMLGMPLMLTPMIDCFSILVIFLLNQLSPTQQVTELANVELPTAQHTAPLTRGPIVALRTDGVFVNEFRVGSFDEVFLSPAALASQLKNGPDGQRVVLQADASMASQIVARMMGVLAHQGHSAIQLAVVKKETPPSVPPVPEARN